MIYNNPELKKVFTAPPMTALRQGPNLRSLMCRAKLSKVTRNSKFKRNAHTNCEVWKNSIRSVAEEYAGRLGCAYSCDNFLSA